jgi:hypothetical protein
MKLNRIHAVLFLLLFFGFSEALAGENDRLVDVEKEIQLLKSQYRQLSQPKTGYEYGPPKLQIRGFGHIGYEYNESSLGNENNFSLGGVDFFITSQVADKLSFITEILFEFEEDGENVLDVERLLLKYEPLNWLNISLGRGHTALGFWNRNYHHGTHLQTTVARPTLFNFEDDDGILPIHFVGLELSGNFKMPFGLVTYYANVANGRGKTTEEIQLVEDGNNDKMFSLMLSLEPKNMEGFGFGGNILYDVIPGNPAGTPSRQNEITEFMVGVHLYYIDQKIEFISELQVIEHEDTRDYYHNGGYTQFAYRFGDVIPYYRFDFMNIENGDPYFIGLPGIEDSIQHTVGFRFDWFAYSALKLEYRYMDADSGASNTISGQVSFAF